MTRSVDFRILGPLEVSDGDRQVALGGARQRALLGMLLLHANEVVSSERLIDELWPEEGTGSVSRNLGLLATVMERWDDAERYFEEALEVNERIGARPWLARTREDYARMLLARGTPADRDKALNLRSAAAATYRDLGMAPTTRRHT